MKHDETIKHRVSRFLIAGALAVCFGALCAISVCAQSTASEKSYIPASVHALPGLQCKVYPKGSDPSSGLPVFTDDDGYARFHAVRAAAGDEVQQLTLDCTDSAGETYHFAVDLTSDDTFAPRPVNLANERGADRPPLKGDPLGYTQSELIQAGYGLRPDPATDAEAYSQWLESASRPGRLLEAKRPVRQSHTTYTGQAAPWAGSVLTGLPSYTSTQATFNVPKAVPGGDGTSSTQISIWNGLGGYSTGSGLIQGGVGLLTSPTAATYFSWREYCCGDPDSNGYGGAFTPGPRDQIFSQEWYCDSAGNLDLNGGYGCTYLHDLTSGAILNCVSPNGSPCWSVQALPLCSSSPGTPNCMTVGQAAEFIIENESDQLTPPTAAFTPFSGQVTMSGSAYSSATNKYSQTIKSDPAVTVLTDFTDSSSHLSVALRSTNQTNFSISSSSGTSSPAIAVRSTGEADVVALGPNNSLLYYWATPGSQWHSTTIAGSGTTYSAPAIAVRPTGEADVVAMGPNNSLMYYWATPGSKWHSTTIAGSGTTHSAPAIAVRSTGEADVAAMGRYTELMYYWATPGSKWHSTRIAGCPAGGACRSPGAASAPAIAVRSTGEADVVVMGLNNSLMYFWATPGSQWNSTSIAGPNTTYSAPAIAVRSTGEADVVVMGPNNSLMYYWATPGSQWYSTTIAGPNTTLSAPAIAVRSTGEADVAAAGMNGWLMYYHATPTSIWYTDTIANWAATLFPPAIAVRSNGEADIASIGDWELDYYWAQPDTAWSKTFIAGLR